MWTDLLQAHGYWILALGCLLEGETLLVLAGYAAHRGLLDPWAVVAVASLAAFAGDQACFWLGRRRGDALLVRWPALSAPVRRVRPLVERWHEALIVGLRFAYGLRIAGPVLMGMSTLSAARFALFNALGAVAWAGMIGAIGWGLGAAAEVWLADLRRVEGLVLAGLAGALVALAVLRRLASRRRAQRRSP